MSQDDPLIEFNALQRAERLHRLRIAMTAAPLLIGTILLLFYVFQLDSVFFPRHGFADFSREKDTREPLFAVLALLMLATSGLGALMLYLQTGFKRAGRTEATESAIYTQALQNMEAYLRDFRESQDQKIAALNQAIEDERSAIRSMKEQEGISLTHDERQEFLTLLRNQLQVSAYAEVVEGLKKQWALDLDRTSQVKLVSDQLMEAKKRITAELEAVNRRGNLNLSIGIVTTLSGLLVLGATVFDRYTGVADYQTILLHYLPRLSLVIFIEIFAYFFLKLYKASLTETKYFQNELTNIESKFTALLVALHRPQELGAAAAVAGLVGTERNFLLKQGESTVDLEALKLENDRQKGLIAELRAFFRKEDEKTK
jgi:hypothetical protein